MYSVVHTMEIVLELELHGGDWILVVVVVGEFALTSLLSVKSMTVKDGECCTDSDWYLRRDPLLLEDLKGCL